MKPLHLLKIVARTANEIAIDLRSKNYGKVLHLFTALNKHFFLGHPYNVTVEPIVECNLQCEFCSSPPTLIKRKKRVLSLSEFEEIINQISPVTHYLWLFLSGEPFLNKDLNKMIRYASSKNMNVTVSTNAIALNEKIIAELVSSNLDHLIISLDGASKETYEKMRKGGKFEQVIKNIESVVKEKKKQRSLKPLIELQLIVTKINEHELQSFSQLAKELGVDKVEFKTLALPKWIYSEKDISEIQQKFFPLREKARYNAALELKEKSKCSAAIKSIILSDGTVCMCCYDINGQYCFGNVFDKPFLEIWENNKYKRTRKLIKNRALPLCKKCAGTEGL